MEKIDANDWKSRLKAYEGIIEVMANPEPEFMMQLQRQMPQYLSDPNQTCQRTALSICDMLFKNCSSIDYSMFAPILIEKCLGSNQQNIDAAIPLVLTCLKYDKEEVMELLFDGLTNKPPKQILAVISVIIAHLASLTAKDKEEVMEIIEQLRPLTKNEDSKIAKESQAAIASAKIVAGDLDLTDTAGYSPKSSRGISSPSKIRYEGEEDWPRLITSDVWKDRKQGYMVLKDLIDPNFPLNQYENKILSAINDEKHVACLEQAIAVIAKFASVFKGQISRRLREYITPVINMMKEKSKRSANSIYEAFDSIASNVSNSPYEPPFQEYLLKMMSSPSIRLREEAVAFIIRCPVLPVSAAVQESLSKLTEDPSLSIRDLVAKALSKIGKEQSPSEIKIPDSQIARAQKRARSPDSSRRSVKRSKTKETAINTWSSWVQSQILAALSSSGWTQVTSGLDQLKEQFTSDPSCPQAIVAGLSTLFLNKTFPPRVMGSIMDSILEYINYDQSKMTPDSINAALSFSLEKIVDKKQESSLFKILDSIAEINGGQFVFSFFYPQLGAKNPMIPQRIATYFAHYISTQTELEIDLESFANEMKPVFSHSDAAVRKAAQDCLMAISSVCGSDALGYFDYVKAVHIADAKKQIHDPESRNDDLDRVIQINDDTPEESSVLRDNNREKEKEKEREKEKEKERERKPRSRISEIPVPKRSQSPKRSARPQSSPEPKSARQTSPEKALISKNILNSISKTSSLLECRKGLEEAEAVLTKQIDRTGQQSMPFSQFTEFFNRLRQWFKDSNPSVVISVARVICVSLKLIKASEIPDIPNEFMSDMMLLLNFTQKAIRTQIIQNMDIILNAMPNFLVDVFLPTFNRLNNDGKVCAIRFLRDVDFEMDVQNFSGFIINCIANMSEVVRESTRPLIIRFLELPGGQQALGKEAEQFPPAKKNSILNTISQYAPKEQSSIAEPSIEEISQPSTPGKESSFSAEQEYESPVAKQKPTKIKSKEEVPTKKSYFRTPPTEEQRNERTNTVDPFLPLWILNSDEQPETLGILLEQLAKQYFEEDVLKTDTASIVSTCRHFLEIATNDFEEFSLVLDIIFLWWANQAILIRHPDGFNEIIRFLQAVLQLIYEHNRVITIFEASLILPTVLECHGRDPKTWKGIQGYIFRVCEIEPLLGVLVKILGIATSVFALTAIFKALMEVIPQCDAKPYYHTLKTTTNKILQLVSDNREQNKELFDAATEFAQFIAQLAPQSPPKPNPSQAKAASNIPIPTKASKAHNEPPREFPKVSTCQLNDAVTERSTDARMMVYTWIVDLMSTEHQVVIQALKNISNQMKTDESILKPHLDALVVSLIIKVHNHFAGPDQPLRLCKYISFCLLTLFSETGLSAFIAKEYIQQLIYEVLTHLSNGVSEDVIAQVLNAVIIKLIEDRSMFAFMGLLAAIGEYDRSTTFNTKWFRLATKCFEECGARICELGNATDICNTFSLIDQFFQMHDITHIEEFPFGGKVLSTIRAYTDLVMRQYGEMVLTRENIKKLGPNSTVLALVGQGGSPKKGSH